MPRAPRIHIEEGLYFITTRGGHGNALFRDNVDRAQYLEVLGRYRKQYHFRLYAYVLMLNYLHLLMGLAKETTVSAIMHDINSSYTKYFNARYGKRGHLFQERFKSVIVEKEAYLAELTRYIHLAPVKDKVSKSPEEYEWSSCRWYFGMPNLDFLGMEEAVAEVLNKFSVHSEEQKTLYREYIDPSKQDKLDSFGRQINNAQALGSKEFMEEVKERIKEDKEEEKKAWVESPSHRIFIIAGSFIIFILVLATIYFYNTKLGLESALHKKDAELGEKLEIEREKTRKNFREKYSADMVSYNAMAKRLEAEKVKTKELEEILEGEKNE